MNIVKEVRKKTGLSILQIAKKTGLSRDALYKIEKDINIPNLTTIDKIKKTFNLDNEIIKIKYFPDVLASAGVGCLVNNENFDIINIDEKQLQEMGIKSNYENIAVIKVKGFSMQPTLQDGDLLFVDLSKKEIFNNRIYIINENNLLKVKRLIRESPFSNKATVKSDNQIDGEYPPYEVDLQNINDNFICGQVIFYCRSIE